MQMAAQTAGGCSDAQGTLPACAPLANPYVPFQNDNPERYAAGRALDRIRQSPASSFVRS